MDALLVRERYKVVRVIDSREDYAFAEAVDILDRETGSCLLNLYEGPLLRRYLPCFDHLKGCAAFQAMFLEGESLVAVFRDCSGTPIDQVFYLGDDHSWRDRLYYAGQLCPGGSEPLGSAGGGGLRPAAFGKCAGRPAGPKDRAAVPPGSYGGNEFSGSSLSGRGSDP